MGTVALGSSFNKNGINHKNKNKFTLGKLNIIKLFSLLTSIKILSIYKYTFKNLLFIQCVAVKKFYECIKIQIATRADNETTVFNVSATHCTLCFSIH
jgi:hypothetical protein